MGNVAGRQCAPVRFARRVVSVRHDLAVGDEQCDVDGERTHLMNERLDDTPQRHLRCTPRTTLWTHPLGRRSRDLDDRPVTLVAEKSRR